MRGTKKIWILLALLAGIESSTSHARADELYKNDFEKAEVNKVPDEFLVLDGGFTVKEEGGNKFLELPGAPLDSFGVLFGPTSRTNIAVRARIRGTSKGRRYPTFGIGLNGQGGYRLRVSPGKGELEIYKGDDPVAHVPYEWKTGTWTMLRLQVIAAGSAWKVEGKAWTQGDTEPAKPLITFDETTEPLAGKAAIWGSPYSTTPIQFDDLSVTPASPP